MMDAAPWTPSPSLTVKVPSDCPAEAGSRMYWCTVLGFASSITAIWSPATHSRGVMPFSSSLSPRPVRVEGSPCAMEAFREWVPCAEGVGSVSLKSREQEPSPTIVARLNRKHSFFIVFVGSVSLPGIDHIVRQRDGKASLDGYLDQCGGRRSVWLDRLGR